MNNKNIVLAVLAIIVIGVIGYGITKYGSFSEVDNNPTSPIVVDTASSTDERRATTTEKQAPVDQKPATFSGKLEEVNTGCFADGECYIMVDGKHVTAIMGWSQETVGTTKGVEGFGDLESHIGKTVEVYANALTDGTYTLYGSAEYYISLAK